MSSVDAAAAVIGGGVVGAAVSRELRRRGVETILLEAPDGKPRGLGEPPIGPIAPAIGNALFALTGVRLRRLPMTPERVRAALGA